MDILRFITAGSVDDGKSTLIGRLLYDSKNILADQLDAIHRAGKTSIEGLPDLALLTDGLRAEREQGITIDVAYKYFATPKRKFIIADAPGHVQYTRNMVTGASKADLIIVLIDARQGVVEQTRRHSIIASLLQIPNVIVAVNKLDLLDYSKEAYDKIVADYEIVAKQLELKHIAYIPISALHGDNVVERSKTISWYKGPSLLEYLETVDIHEEEKSDELGRFSVQYVIRPQTTALHDYRGYAGKVISGAYRVGDEVTVLPSGATSRISAIEYNLDKVTEATFGQSIILHLADDIDISRGDLIVINNHRQPIISQEQEALICWMDDKPLKIGNRYTLQLHSRTVTAVVKQIEHRVDVQTLATLPAEQATLNEIVRVRLRTASPLAYDPYSSLRTNGGFILVDETSHITAGGGLFQ
jgi:sulfate adenylyltransferase subunit 1